LKPFYSTVFAYSFGLKVNAFIFRQIAESIDYSIINKIRQNLSNLKLYYSEFRDGLITRRMTNENMETGI
jgi:hypothetical protein